MIYLRTTETTTQVGCKETRVTRPRASPKKQSQVAATSKTVQEGYLEILGSAEPSTTINSSVNNEDEELAQIRRDMQITLQKAMKAAQDGEAEEAAYLFRLHSRMKIELPKRPITTSSGFVNSESKQREQEQVTLSDTQVETGEIEKPIVENGITFMPGEIHLLYVL